MLQSSALLRAAIWTDSRRCSDAGSSTSKTSEIHGRADGFCCCRSGWSRCGGRLGPRVCAPRTPRSTGPYLRCFARSDVRLSAGLRRRSRPPLIRTPADIVTRPNCSMIFSNAATSPPVDWPVLLARVSALCWAACPPQARRGQALRARDRPGRRTWLGVGGSDRPDSVRRSLACLGLARPDTCTPKYCCRTSKSRPNGSLSPQREPRSSVSAPVSERPRARSWS